MGWQKLGGAGPGVGGKLSVVAVLPILWSMPRPFGLKTPAATESSSGKLLKHASIKHFY